MSENKRKQSEVEYWKQQCAKMHQYITRILERLKVVGEVWTSLQDIGKEMNQELHGASRPASKEKHTSRSYIG